jgi:hypothetical protein
MFIPGMFFCVCGDAAGVGEDAGWSIPGIFIAGTVDGDAFGVGEGMVIECCAAAESAPARNTKMGNRTYRILELKAFMTLLLRTRNPLPSDFVNGAA